MSRGEPCLSNHNAIMKLSALNSLLKFIPPLCRYSPDQVAKEAPLRPPNVPNKPKYHDGIIKYRQLETVNQSIFNKINAIYLGRVSYVDWASVNKWSF